MKLKIKQKQKKTQREKKKILNVHKMLKKLYVILQSELIYSNRYAICCCCCFSSNCTFRGTWIDKLSASMDSRSGSICRETAFRTFDYLITSQWGWIMLHEVGNINFYFYDTCGLDVTQRGCGETIKFNQHKMFEERNFPCH